MPPPPPPGSPSDDARMSRVKVSVRAPHQRDGESSKKLSRRRSQRMTTPAPSSSASAKSPSFSPSSPSLVFARHDIPAVLATLAAATPASEKARGLVRVSQLARLLTDAHEWAVVFPQLVIAVVGTLGTNFPPSTRVHALMALRTMLECHPQPFHALIDVVLRSTLEACRDDVQDVLSSAGTTLGLMAKKLNPTQCARAVLPIIALQSEVVSEGRGTEVVGRGAGGGRTADSAEEEGAVLRMGLRTLSLLVPKMSSATVYAALQDLMPPVLSAINSPVSATRKEAVFLFVRVYNSVGDAHARPYMGKLSVAQSKLVTIYVQRSRQAGTGKISQ